MFDAAYLFVIYYTYPSLSLFFLHSVPRWYFELLQISHSWLVIVIRKCKKCINSRVTIYVKLVDPLKTTPLKRDFPGFFTER